MYIYLYLFIYSTKLTYPVVQLLFCGNLIFRNLKGSRLVSLPRVRVLPSSWIEVLRCSLQPAFHNDSRRYLVTFYAKSIRETARTL